MQHLYQKLLEFGATGGKLLGAGGSGYLLIWVDSRKQLQFWRIPRLKDFVLSELILTMVEQEFCMTEKQCLIIAEIGNNHNGCLERAKNLVAAAVIAEQTMQSFR